MNKQFLFEILELAEKHCGSDFTRKLLQIRTERERILNNVWKKEPLPEDLSTYQKEIILRDIDFDTIIHHAAKCVGKDENNMFLFDVAQVAIKHGEFGRGKELLLVLLKTVGQKSLNLLADILRKLGNIEFYTNNFKAAYKYFEKSLKLFTKIGDKAGIISIKNVVGALLVEEGKYYEGEIRFIQVRKMAQEIKLNDMIAKANMNLGNIYIIRGIYTEAASCYKNALDVVANSKDKDLLTNLYLNFAICYKFKGDFKIALEYLGKAFDQIKDTNNRYQKGLLYLIKAEIECVSGNLSAATALVTSAFAIFNETGDRLSTAEAYKILGMINREDKKYDIALSYFENSQRIYTNPFYIAETQVEMAHLYLAINDRVMAKKVLTQAVKSYEKIGATSKVEKLRSVFGNVL
ncbi:MAG: tetratricopeptide repeat protein [Candidatus Marinimicrobia bacterium]|nr:tetratricopeptide repeat protein [Candidatus Neomarinimicrobiota bacterium]